ncbi:MAG: hypothetical protein ACRECH_15270, partial [Nitrososphaerales archaeon]
AYHARRFCFSGRSKYQKIDIIDNEAYGRMLFLDDNVQHTAYDAHIFNEALCGPVKRKGVSRVVVLGAGSGQTVLSLLESSEISQVTVIEIDGLVVKCCSKYIKGVEQAFGDQRVKIVIADAFAYLHATDDEFDACVIDFTEKPFGMKRNLPILMRLYKDIREKCKGRCSQYIGSSVQLAYGPQLKSVADRLTKKFLSNVRYEDVFIPSFGAPHTFMHAGYDEKPQKTIGW